MKLFVIFKCVIVFTQVFALPVEENEIKPSDEVSLSDEDAEEIKSISRHKKSHPTVCVEIKPSVNNERPFVMCKNSFQSPVNGYALSNSGGPYPQNNYGNSDVNNGYKSRNYGIPIHRNNPQISNYNAGINPSYGMPSGYQNSGYAQPNHLYNGAYNSANYLGRPANIANMNYRQQRPTEYRTNYRYDSPSNQIHTNYGAYSRQSPYSQPQVYSQNYNTNAYKPSTCGSSLLVGCQPRVIPIGCNAPAQTPYSSYAPQTVPVKPYYTEQAQLKPQVYHPQYYNPQPVQNDIKLIPQDYRSSSKNESSLSSTHTVQASNNVSTSTQSPQPIDKTSSQSTSNDKEKPSMMAQTLDPGTMTKIKEMKTILTEANKEATAVSSSNNIPGANAQGPPNSQQTSFYSSW